MKRAGIDVSKNKPYSIRHASASAMVKKGIAIETVLKLGRWKSLSTFLKYYLRTSPDDDIVAILSNSLNQDASTQDAVVSHAARESSNFTSTMRAISSRRRPRV